jgi:hypothetical protein
VPPVAAALALKVIDPEVAFRALRAFASPVVAVVALTLPPVALTGIKTRKSRYPYAVALPVVALVVTLPAARTSCSSP